MEKSGQFHAVAALPPVIECLVHIQYEVEWAPVLVWMLWRRDKYHAAISQGTVPPTLVWLWLWQGVILCAHTVINPCMSQFWDVCVYTTDRVFTFSERNIAGISWIYHVLVPCCHLSICNNRRAPFVWSVGSEPWNKGCWHSASWSQQGEKERPSCFPSLRKDVGVPWDVVLFCCNTGCSVAVLDSSFRSSKNQQQNLFLEFHTTSCQLVCQRRYGRMRKGKCAVWVEHETATSLCRG